MARSVSPVFDASALICFARREPGWEAVALYGSTGVISAVNLTEVAYRLSNHGVPLEKTELIIRPLVGEIVAFDDQQAMLAASIHARSRNAGLSLGDCACIALGLTRGAKVITADRHWKTLSLGVEIVQIR